MSIEKLGSCGFGIGAFWKLEREAAKRPGMAQIVLQTIALEALAIVSLAYHAVFSVVGRLYQSPESLNHRHIEPLKQSLALMRHAYAKAAQADSLTGVVRQETKVLFPGAKASKFTWLNKGLTAVVLSAAVVGLYLYLNRRNNPLPYSKDPLPTSTEELENIADGLFSQWKGSRTKCAELGGYFKRQEDQRVCSGLAWSWPAEPPTNPQTLNFLNSNTLFSGKEFKGPHCTDETLTQMCRKLATRQVDLDWSQQVLGLGADASCSGIKTAYLNKAKDLFSVSARECADPEGWKTKQEAWLNCISVARDVAGIKCATNTSHPTVTSEGWNEEWKFLEEQRDLCFGNFWHIFKFQIAEQWDGNKGHIPVIGYTNSCKTLSNQDYADFVLQHLFDKR